MPSHSLPLAAALLIASTSTLAEPPPAAPTPAAAPANIAAHPEEQVSKDRLLATLQSLPTKRSANGTDEHRKGLHDTEELLLTRLRDLGYAPTTHEFDFLGSSREGRSTPDAQHQPWRNLIVEIPGRTLPDEVLIFSAHFDAVAAAPGADDDGSGVAAILEMALLLKDRPMQRTLRLCLFNLEEVGLVGSRAYVQSIEGQIKGEPIPPAPDAPADAPPQRKPPTKRFVGMVSMDGIGYYSDAPNSQKTPIPESKLFKPPTVGDFLGVAGDLKYRTFSQAFDKALHASAPKLKTVVVDFLPTALVPDLLRSDHAPFLGAGVPAVIAADTANFRNPHYHRATDTIETLDMDRYTEAVRGLIGAAYRLAGPVGEPLIQLVPTKAPELSEPAATPK